MLPHAGQLLSTGKTTGASLSMSACVIAAQLVMIPVAALAGTLADRWGRRRVFLIGFLVLPIRGCLYTLSDDPVYIVMVQLLDGIGAGIFDVLWVTLSRTSRRAPDDIMRPLAPSPQRKASARR